MGGGRDVVERIIELCAAAATSHADGFSSQEGLGLGSGWCDVALSGASLTVDPTDGSAGDDAPPSGKPDVCSVTGEPVLRTISHAKASGDWDGPGGWREAHAKDYARCFVEFGCMRIVPVREYLEARRQFGSRA